MSRRDLINGWIAITLGVSVVAWLDGGFLAHHAALAPARIWRGEVWRLGTWIFVELSPVSLIFTCVAIYKFGGELVPRWGTRRLWRFMVEVVLAAAIVTALVGLVSDDARQTIRCGGLVVADVLTIAWARQFPTAALALYHGLLVLRGKQLVMVVVGVVVLWAAYIGPLHLIPELVATGFAALYPRPRLERL